MSYNHIDEFKLYLSQFQLGEYGWKNVLYFDFEYVLTLANDILNKDSASYMEMDNLLAEAITDLQIYQLCPDFLQLPVNNHYFYLRQSSGMEQVCRIVDFLASHGIEYFPNLSNRLIKIIVADNQNVEVEVDYNMTSSRSMDKFNCKDLLDYMISKDGIDASFYESLEKALERKTYREESEFLRMRVMNCKKLV